MIFRKALSPSTGLLALDLDGTVAGNKHAGLEAEMKATLEKGYAKGWLIAFITGRTFTRAMQTLEGLSFPYLVAPQNGALVVQMPEKKILWREYIGKETILKADQFLRFPGNDFILYCGFDQDDACYWRPQNFSKEKIEYFAWRKTRSMEDWQETPSFEALSLSGAASIKWFGSKEELDPLSMTAAETLGLQGPIIKDPFDASIFILQATSPEVNKGKVAKKIQKAFDLGGRPLCAAGDDANDLPMLQVADYAIAMAGASQELTKVAHEVSTSLTASLNQIFKDMQ